MTNDQEQLKELYDNWIKATTLGDLGLAHACIADDAIFYVPGAGEMDKATFAEGAAGVKPEDCPIEFGLKSELKEVKIFGDHAYMTVESSLLMTPKNGDPASTMAGHSLSILQKLDGRWQIIRDANTLVVVPD